MKKLNELIVAHESQVQLNLDDGQLSATLDEIGEAALIDNAGKRLVLVLRGIKTKLTETERMILCDVAACGSDTKGYPVYILRSVNGDDFYSLSEFFGNKESQPFATGSVDLIFDIIAGL